MDETKQAMRRRAIAQAAAPAADGRQTFAQTFNSVNNERMRSNAAGAIRDALVRKLMSGGSADVGNMLTSSKGGAGRMASMARGALPVQMAGGALTAMGDSASGYRDNFQQSMGVSTPGGSLVNDAARVMGTVGDAVTGGIAGRVGRGVSSAIGGDGFGNGFFSQDARTDYAQGMQRRPVADNSLVQPRVTSNMPLRRRNPNLSSLNVEF